MIFKVQVLKTHRIRTKNRVGYTARVDIEGSGIGVICLNLTPELFDLFDQSIDHEGQLKCEFSIQENNVENV